jgi:hypothetical protein
LFDTNFPILLVGGQECTGWPKRRLASCHPPGEVGHAWKLSQDSVREKPKAGGDGIEERAQNFGPRFRKFGV